MLSIGKMSVGHYKFFCAVILCCGKDYAVGGGTHVEVTNITMGQCESDCTPF